MLYERIQIKTPIIIHHQLTFSEIMAESLRMAKAAMYSCPIMVRLLLLGGAIPLYQARFALPGGVVSGLCRALAGRSGLFRVVGLF